MLLREQIKPELWLLFDRCLIIVTIGAILVIVSWWKHWYYKKNNIEKLENTLNIFPYSLEYRLHVWAQYMETFAMFTEEISWLVDIEQHAEALRRVKIFADENVKKESLKKIMARMELWGDEDEAESLAELLFKQEKDFDVETWTRKDEEEILKKGVLFKQIPLKWQPEEVISYRQEQSSQRPITGFVEDDQLYYFALYSFTKQESVDLELIWIDYWSAFVYFYRWISFVIAGLWEYIPWIYIYNTFEKLIEDQAFVLIYYPFLKFMDALGTDDIEKYKDLTEYFVFDAFLYREYRLRTNEYLFESLTERNAVDELYTRVQHRPWDWTVGFGSNAWLDYDYLEDTYRARPGWAQFYHTYGQYRHKRLEDQTYFEHKWSVPYESLFIHTTEWLVDEDVGQKMERDRNELRHGTYTPWSVKTLREWRRWYWPFATSTFKLARIFYQRYMRW